MQTVAETPLFARRAADLLSAAERFELITLLAAEPTAGDVIKGTGGVRKLRFRAAGRGKSGGVRVIYYYLDDSRPVLAILLYAKNERENLSADQLRAVASIATRIKAKR